MYPIFNVVVMSLLLLLIAVSYACDMLGCSVKLLEQCLTKKSVETSRDVILTPLSAAEVS